MGTPDQDLSQRIISPPGEKCKLFGWRILSYADLRDRSDCEQPSANSGQPKRPEITSTTDAKSYPHNENKAGSTTTWHLPKRRSVLKETLEQGPAFIMRILDPLEKGISL